MGDVIPDFPCWPLSVEKALEWSEQERDLFLNPAPGSDSRLLDHNDQAPLATNCLIAASAEAKRKGPHAAGWEVQGLSGFGVFSMVLDGFRFPH